MLNYLHNHPEFKDVLRAVEHEIKIERSLVEKDYWIMHCIYGLQQCGFEFELKGGTSLSKGYGIIDRFSEDIDIRIEPPNKMKLPVGKNHNKPAQCEARRKYYDWLECQIKIDGIDKVKRDREFDNPKTYMSGGIRLYYKESFSIVEGVREGVLLEVGFDDVTPNNPMDISSWALDFANEKGMEIKDNKAYRVRCYDPCYTFVEKLQTIIAKFRNYRENGLLPANFLRHYYDVYCLLQRDEVRKFIGTPAYEAHKSKRFPAKDRTTPMAQQEAFLLSNEEIRTQFDRAFQRTSSLYYQGQPLFKEILELILKYLPDL